MLSTAIWVLEQEAAWVSRNLTYTRQSENDPTGLIFASTFGVAQTAAISLTPYYQISKASSALRWVADDIAYSRKHPILSKFWPLTGHLHNYHPKLLRFARKGGMRRLAVKVGARAVPGLGWALFAVDMWMVGKWIGEKTNPFD